MVEPAPSPFEGRTLSESTLYLYIDGIDLTPFANRADLENATLEFAQGKVEQFKVRLRHRASQPLPGGGTMHANLPVIREGMVPVVYLQLLSDVPGAYNVLFSGKVGKRNIDDDDIRGSTVLEVSTPMKMLKHETTMIFENKGDVKERNDVARLRGVGLKWGNRDFDFSLPEWGTGDDITYNITYPLPNFSADSSFFVNGERFSTFTEQSVDDIVRDIMTDPGQEADADYPVVNRQWWWEGRFIDQAVPTKGVRWHLVMAKGVGITHEYSLDLMDAPDARFPGAYIYEKGASLSIDYMPVVRRVVVSGDEFPVSPEVQVGPGVIEMVASGGSVGHAPNYRIGVPAAGWVRKINGSNDHWDSAVGGNDADPSHVQPAFNGITQLTNDFDLYFRVQETYLFHDAFRGPNTASITNSQMFEPLDPGFPPGQWLTTYMDTVEATHNTMGRLHNQARPHFPRGRALILARARASTCIVRGTPGETGEGMALPFRATRSADPNNVLTSAILLLIEGGVWKMYEYTGSGYPGTRLDTGAGHALVDGDGHLLNLKVSLLHDTVQVFFSDVEDTDFRLTTYSFNIDETLHGVGALDAASAGGVMWRDFSVTEFWGDKAIGVGAEDSGDEWFWIGYGYTINEDGTFSLIRGGQITSNNIHDACSSGTICTLGLGDYGQPGDSYDYDTLAALAPDMPNDVPYLWEDIDRAAQKVNGDNIGFFYNDVFKIASVLYLDDTTRSVMRKVQWWYQPGGAGEWLLLREEVGLPMDTIKPLYAPENNPNFPDAQQDHFWYIQVALKDLGATFTSISITPDYSDIFMPTGDLAQCLVPLQGDFPATGVIRSSRFNSYIRRQRVGNAVLREYGDPRVELVCTVHPPMQGGYVLQPFQRGDIVRVTNRRAGWLLPQDCEERVDTGCGPDEEDCDTRRYLVVRSIQRIEGGTRSRRPSYRLILGSRQYDITDPARTHILAGGVQDSVLYNFSNPETALVSFVADSQAGILTFHEGDQSNSSVYGVATQVRMKAPDATAWLPTLEWPAGVRKMQIPPGYAPSNSKMDVQHRTKAKDGTFSKWSAAYTMVTQAQPAYDRSFNLGFLIGNGIDIISTTTDDECDEWQVNEGCAITGWSVVHNGTGDDNHIVADIQWCGEKDRTEYGVSHYVSLAGDDGIKPYAGYNEHAHSGSATQGQDFRGWDEKRTKLNKGDWIRLKVTRIFGATNATKGTVMLTLSRAEIPTSAGGEGE